MAAEPIEFEVNGLTLRGNLHLSDGEGKDLALLFLHGWTGRPNDDAAEFLASHGFSAMTFSLSGHSSSDGKIEEQTRKKSFQEVLAAYDFFKAKLPNGIKIGVAGSSYGGYLAVLLSAERPVRCLSLRVPANYSDEEFTEPQLRQTAEFNPAVVEWRRMSLNYHEAKSLTALHKFGGSVQIFEAEKDEQVPHQTVQNYVNAVADKSKLDYHLMEGWPHSLGNNKERNDQYRGILLNWLNQQI